MPDFSEHCNGLPTLLIRDLNNTRLSTGAVLVRLSTDEICVLHDRERHEYVLPYTSRSYIERPRDTAMRTATESTGFRCHLPVVNLLTHVGSTITKRAGMSHGIPEPFTLQICHVEDDQVQVIWRFVVEVDEKQPQSEFRLHKKRYAVEFYSYADVHSKLTIQLDREMVRKAIDVLGATYPWSDKKYRG
ncbi:hypothetical protein C8A03DRAFT_44567 [Achaetomium macrosporum]|uniref:Uncharacterized protein n=1 Tax=Achaetomium macrosporum TaxID=79813 RepID=A0AAN7CAU8_9PEZI|nr:hypothetical protein C8A03DRAFT_44567 [Achaetomium macrosporum]